MRIRSSLTDGTIYESIRQRRETANNRNTSHPRGSASGGRSRNTPTRRLGRLIILLVLVLILMREAANPAVYRNFFAALGAPVAGEPLPAEITRSQMQAILTQAQAAEAEELSAPQSSAIELPKSVSQDSLDTLVIDLGREGRSRLTEWLAAVRRFERQSSAGDHPELPEAPLNQASGGSQKISGLVSDVAPEVDILEMLASAAAGSGQMDPQIISAQFSDPANILGPAGRSLRRGLQAALDREYLTRVSDATIWNKNDADAFYRCLELSRNGELAFQQPPAFVGFVSLLDQPAVYRGSRVALRGTAVRAEYLRAADNPFGVDDYWLVWVRPEDGSDRPIMGYTGELPESLKGLTSTGVDQGGPEVLVDGFFLRRHLYQSQKGSELAPVIVGTVHAISAERSVLGAGTTGLNRSANGQPVSKQVMQLVLVAAIAGIGFTLAVAIYTARSSRLRRQIRQRGLTAPTQFLPVDDFGGLMTSNTPAAEEK